MNKTHRNDKELYITALISEFYSYTQCEKYVGFFLFQKIYIGSSEISIVNLK